MALPFEDALAAVGGLHVAAAIACVVLATLFALYLTLCRSSKGPSKKTAKKKEKKAEKSKTEGGKAEVSAPPTSGSSAKEAEEPIPIKKQKKVPVTEDERQAKKAEAARRKAQSLAATEKRMASLEEVGGVAGKKAAARQRAEELATQKSKEQEILEKFNKAQERVKKTTTAPVKASGGSFAAFADDDSD
mmetsp:Transcript_39331/g.69195  ORF Transcript_39331/g.69195 Transcript_39331/m.69195 type:complete len:190 (-) Transcript_39331:27-596(-)